MKHGVYSVSGTRCVELNKTDLVPGLYTSAMYRCGGKTPNLDFNVTIFFNVKCLENGTR